MHDEVHSASFPPKAHTVELASLSHRKADRARSSFSAALSCAAVCEMHGGRGERGGRAGGGGRTSESGCSMIEAQMMVHAQTHSNIVGCKGVDDIILCITMLFPLGNCQFISIRGHSLAFNSLLKGPCGS